MKKETVDFSKKMIRCIARKLAERDANTTCPYYTYQAKLPLAVEKLKKS